MHKLKDRVLSELWDESESLKYKTEFLNDLNENSEKSSLVGSKIVVD